MYSETRLQNIKTTDQMPQLCKGMRQYQWTITTDTS